MKKTQKSILVIFSTVLFFLGMTSKVFSEMLPNNIIINTSESTIAQVRYETYYLFANRILPEGNGDVAYCMEIDKEYPHGERFTKSDSITYDIDNLLSLGYPNLTASELGVNTEDEACFATQIAIWCYLEGYDANEITGENKRIIDAIKYIYNGNLRGISGRNNYDYKIYTKDEAVQDIVILSRKDEAIIKPEISQYNISK